MPSAAPSPALPTARVTVLSTAKCVALVIVAVTRTVFLPPSSATESWSLSVPVSASNVIVIADGAASSSVMVPTALPLFASMLTPVPESSAASAGALSTARKVSAGSSSMSSVVTTVKVCVVTPFAKLSVCAVVTAL